MPTGHWSTQSGSEFEEESENELSVHMRLPSPAVAGGGRRERIRAASSAEDTAGDPGNESDQRTDCVAVV